MALDNPVLPEGLPQFRRSSRLFELCVVVAMTVAVVAVAAVWGQASDSDQTVSQGSAGPAVFPESAGVELSSDAPVIASATVRQQAAPLANMEPAPTVATETGINPEIAIPAQTGIVPGQPDPPAPSIPASFERYQVQRGESLFSIAGAHGVSVEELLSWNWQLDADSVLIRGEWLWIPQWSLSSVADESAGAAEDGKSGRGGG